MIQIGWFDFLDPIKIALELFLASTGMTVPPYSTLFLVFISFIVSSLSGIVNRLLLDMEKMEKQNAEQQEHTKLKKKAKETADKRLWRKVQKNDERMTQLQRSTMMKRMLPSFITMLPIFFVFSIMRATFQYPANTALNQFFVDGVCENSCGVTAVLPFSVPEWFPLIGSWFSPFALDNTLSVAGFGFWYFLSAIITSTLTQKLFGFNISGMKNPGMGGVGR